MLTPAKKGLYVPGSLVCGSSNVPCTSGSGGSINRTYCHAFSAWGDFNGVQLVFVNTSAGPGIVDNAVTAPSSSIYPGGVNNIAAPQGGGVFSAPTGSLTVPAGSAFAPGILVTPLIPQMSLSRAAGELDGGLYPLTLVRAFINTAVTNSFANLAGMFDANWIPVNQGFTFQSNFASGDQVSAPGGLVALANSADPLIACFGVIFSYNEKMIVHCGIGDSIMAGVNDQVTNNCPYGFKATATLRASGKMISWFNAGISGSPMPSILAHGLAILAQVAPDICTIPCYTVNSPTAAQSDWDTQWQEVMQLAQAILAAGKKVNIMTPLPNNAFTATTNGYRLKQRQRVMNSGLPFCDIESTLVDVAGGQGHYLSGLCQADGTHLNPAGHAVTGVKLVPSLAANFQL